VGRYLIRRLLLILPTLFGIMLVNFAVIQFAPGGPIDQIVAQSSGLAMSGAQAISGGGQGGAGSSQGGGYSGAAGLPADMLAELEKQFGFDRPVHERFIRMIWNYLRLDFGRSYFQERPVFDLVRERLPVSVSLGLWTLLLVYVIAVPLGIAKAVRDGTSFDLWTSVAVFVAYAIPGFLLAVMLIIFFAGGSYLDWFPMRGLVSDNFAELSVFGKIRDYLWHMALPLTALTVGGFATLVMLTKNSFLEELGKPFVVTARSKGLSERRVLYGHVFRNAMLIVIAGFPAAFVSILYSGALLIEIIFSLDGIGLLGFDAAIKRDYPILFGTLFVFTLIGLVMQLVGDIVYTLIDPRIDFERRSV